MAALFVSWRCANCSVCVMSNWSSTHILNTVPFVLCVTSVCCLVYPTLCSRDVWNVRGLALLLRVGTLWRCGDGLCFRSISLGKRYTSYNAPPTSRKRAADRWSLRNFLPRSSLFMYGKTQKSHGARSGLYGGCSNGVPPIHFFQDENIIQSRSRPMWFLGFPNHEKGALRQEISKWSTVCGTFSISRWSVVRITSLAKGGTSKKRPSPHQHEGPTRSNKVSPRTFQTALVYWAGAHLTDIVTTMVKRWSCRCA
jgi:hypothetical protein